MVSNKVVLLALVLITIVVLASVAKPTNSITTVGTPASEDDTIGTTNDSPTASAPAGDVVAGTLVLSVPQVYGSSK